MDSGMLEPIVRDTGLARRTDADKENFDIM